MNQMKCINLILDILINFQNNPFFNKIVDKHLNTLIEKGVDLKEYFESSLPLFQIKNDEYEDLHENNETAIYPVNIDHINEIYGKYNELIGSKLSGSTDGGESLYPIEYFMVNIPESLTNEPKKFINTLCE